jgi:hypothetical protein
MAISGNNPAKARYITEHEAKLIAKELDVPMEYVESQFNVMPAKFMPANGFPPVPHDWLKDEFYRYFLAGKEFPLAPIIDRPQSRFAPRFSLEKESTR